MKTLIIILICLMTTLCFADVKGKALEKIALQKEITAEQVENEVKSDAVEKIVQTEIDDITERIRRQKIDEAKKYSPTDEEIIVEIQKRIDKLKEPKKEMP